MQLHQYVTQSESEINTTYQGCSLVLISPLHRIANFSPLHRIADFKSNFGESSLCNRRLCSSKAPDRSATWLCQSTARGTFPLPIALRPNDSFSIDCRPWRSMHLLSCTGDSYPVVRSAIDFTTDMEPALPKVKISLAFKIVLMGPLKIGFPKRRCIGREVTLAQHLYISPISSDRTVVDPPRRRCQTATQTQPLHSLLRPLVRSHVPLSSLVRDTRKCFTAIETTFSPSKCGKLLTAIYVLI